MTQLLEYRDNTRFLHELDECIATFTKTNKTLLYIEPYGSAMSLLTYSLTRKPTGCNIIILTANADLRRVPDTCISSAHLAIQVDTANFNKLLKLVKLISRKNSIHGVIPGFEYFVPTAVKIAKYLHLPGMDLLSGQRLRNKKQMRLRLQTYAIAQPKFTIVEDLAQLDQQMYSIKFPAVCKPIDAAGSVFVAKVNNVAELKQAALKIVDNQELLWGHRLSTVVLVEEYIAGKEYSIEGVVNNNEATIFSITEKFVADQTDFIEVGHIVNIPLQETLRSRISEYVTNVVKILGANACPFHAEIRMDKNGDPLVMEVAARLPGDRIGELINLVNNENYYEAVLRAYLNEPSINSIPKNDVAGIQFFYRKDIAKFSNVSCSDIELNYNEEIKIYYQVGETIPAFPKPLRRLGHVIGTHQDYEILKARLFLIDKAVKFDE